MEIYSGYLKDNKAEIEKSIEEFGFKQGLKSNELYRIWLRIMQSSKRSLS